MPSPLKIASVRSSLAIASPKTPPQSREKPVAAQGTNRRRELRGWAIRPTGPCIGTPVHVHIPAFWSNCLSGRMAPPPVDTPISWPG